MRSGELNAGLLRADCMKQLKISENLFPEIARFLLQVFMDKSAEGRSKSIGNTMTVQRNPP